MVLILIIATAALLISINALYVAAEFSTVSVQRTRINQLAGSGNRLANALWPIIEDTRTLDNYVAACQVGVTISSLILGAFGQAVVVSRLTEPVGQLMLWLQVGGDSPLLAVTIAQSISAIVILLAFTGLQVVLGELFPKSVAVQYPEEVALATAVPMKWSLWLLRPLVWFFNGNAALILRLFGYEREISHSRIHSPREIEILVGESHEGGILDDEERQLLRNAFRLRDLTARQIMVHRTRILALPVETTAAELLEKSIETGFTRIPLYRETIDQIVGFVHIKDVFRLHAAGKQEIGEAMREIMYAPESMAAADLWEKLNNQRHYMAVVFDEYGGTAGLITIEDLIEEIFGELQDEFDDEMDLVSQDKEGRIYLRADLLVTDLNEYLGLKLPDEMADTLGGLVLSELGRPPHEGDEVALAGTIIRVHAVDDLSISEVSLQLPMSDSLSQLGEWVVADHE
jgi:CBS domain containing-hemolysin-like protein